MWWLTRSSWHRRLALKLPSVTVQRDSVTDLAEEASVGARLRRLRRARRLTLKELGDRAGLSESFLSQLERGRTGATIASIQRIAEALGVEVSDVFAPLGDDHARVLRADDRELVAWGRLGRKALLTPKPFESLEVVAAEFDEGGSTGDEPYSHGDSEELFVVIAGTVELELDAERLRLGPGDTARYRSSIPHRVHNPGPGRAEVLFIVSPPSY